MARARATAAILAATALLVFAPAASATKTVHRRAHLFGELSGKATNGFSFLLFAFDRSAVLSVTDKAGHSDIETVSYYGLDREGLRGLTDGRIDLNIGNRGHFRGHFVTKSTKTKQPEKNCKGDPSTTEEGYFAGSFVFHGERGYTTIQASRARGAIIRQGATDCQVRAEPGGNPKRLEEAIEKAEKAADTDDARLLAGEGDGNLVLQATRERFSPGSKQTTSSFEVSDEGPRVGAFRVYRSAFVFGTELGGAPTFLTPNQQEPLAEAVIEPPAPFSGSATFKLEGPKKASWTGDLAVELPGAGKVALTGKHLYAGVCGKEDDCTETLPRPLAEQLEHGYGYASSTATVEVQTIS